MKHIPISRCVAVLLLLFTCASAHAVEYTYTTVWQPEPPPAEVTEPENVTYPVAYVMRSSVGRIEFEQVPLDPRFRHERARVRLPGVFYYAPHGYYGRIVNPLFYLLWTR